MAERQVNTPDGRVLQVVELGAVDGQPVLVHGGTPNSRLLYPPNVATAERQGIRLISYDRPGYGGSTRKPDRTIADCAEDVRTIAAALGIERLGVWGISGGGPHALACAALLPDLVPAVGVLASSAPWNAPGLDYFDGMGEMNVDDLRLMLEDPVAARAKLEGDRLEMLGTTTEGLLEFMKTLLSPVDAEVMSGDLAQHMVESMQVGLAPGADGWWDDAAAELADWGFRIEAIRTPVLLLHGRHDQFVPFAHGQWLAERIPGVRAELSDDDGHLTLIEHHLPHVHDWLLEHLAVDGSSSA